MALGWQDRYKPRQDENGIAGGEGFLHYSADGKFVTVSSGQGDPAKAPWDPSLDVKLTSQSAAQHNFFASLDLIRLIRLDPFHFRTFWSRSSVMAFS